LWHYATGQKVTGGGGGGGGGGVIRIISWKERLLRVCLCASKRKESIYSYGLCRPKDVPLRITTTTTNVSSRNNWKTARRKFLPS
jgi:hypothetical protein